MAFLPTEYSQNLVNKKQLV